MRLQLRWREPSLELPPSGPAVSSAGWEALAVALAVALPLWRGWLGAGLPADAAGLLGQAGSVATGWWGGGALLASALSPAIGSAAAASVVAVGCFSVGAVLARRLLLRLGFSRASAALGAVAYGTAPVAASAILGQGWWFGAAGLAAAPAALELLHRTLVQPRFGRAVAAGVGFALAWWLWPAAAPALTVAAALLVFSVADSRASLRAGLVAAVTSFALAAWWLVPALADAGWWGSQSWLATSPADLLLPGSRLYLGWVVLALAAVLFCCWFRRLQSEPQRRLVVGWTALALATAAAPTVAATLAALSGSAVSGPLAADWWPWLAAVAFGAAALFTLRELSGPAGPRRWPWAAVTAAVLAAALLPWSRWLSGEGWLATYGGRWAAAAVAGALFSSVAVAAAAEVAHGLVKDREWRAWLAAALLIAMLGAAWTSSDYFGSVSGSAAPLGDVPVLALEAGNPLAGAVRRQAPWHWATWPSQAVPPQVRELFDRGVYPALYAGNWSAASALLSAVGVRAVVDDASVEPNFGWNVPLPRGVPTVPMGSAVAVPTGRGWGAWLLTERAGIAAEGAERWRLVAAEVGYAATVPLSAGAEGVSSDSIGALSRVRIGASLAPAAASAWRTAAGASATTTPAPVGQPATWVELSGGPRRFALDVPASASGTLVAVTVPFDGRWRAKVDGRPVPTVAAYGVALGAEVPPAGGRLTLRWGVTAAAAAGRGVSAVGLAVAGLLWWQASRRRPSSVR